MYFKSTLLVITLLFICSSLFGQVVTAKLIDSETKEVIKDAKVMVKSSRDLTSTNIAGFFQVKADTTDYLLIKAIGYETSEIKIPTTGLFIIALQKKVEEEIFTMVEDPSVPKEGFSAFIKDMETKLNCPVVGIADTLLVTMVIDKTGKKHITKILKSAGISCDEHIIQLLNNTSDWIPAKQRQKEVSQQINMLVLYQNGKPIVDILPPSLNNLWYYLAMNFALPLEQQKEVQEGRFYVFVELNQSFLSEVKLLNNTDSNTGKILVDVIRKAPIELFDGFSEGQSKFIIPVSVKFDDKAIYLDHLKLPDGELLDEYSFTVKSAHSKQKK